MVRGDFAPQLMLMDARNIHNWVAEILAEYLEASVGYLPTFDPFHLRAK